jgi:hypothetical protein
MRWSDSKSLSLKTTVDQFLKEDGEWFLFINKRSHFIENEEYKKGSDSGSSKGADTFTTGTNAEFYAIQGWKRSDARPNSSDGFIGQTPGYTSPADAEIIVHREIYPGFGDYICRVEWNKPWNLINKGFNLKVIDVLDVWQIDDVDFPFHKTRAFARCLCSRQIVVLSTIRENLPSLNNIKLLNNETNQWRKF